MKRQPAECGTRSGYTGGCHCDACKLANATYQKTRYQTNAVAREVRKASARAYRAVRGVRGGTISPPP